jgi:hypothetical protein
VWASNAALTLVPDTIVCGSDQTLTIIGSDTKFLGFGELLLPVTGVGFIAVDGTMNTIPAEVISNYAVHVPDLSTLLPGVYTIEVRNENEDAYRLTDVSLTITAAPVTDVALLSVPTNEQGEEAIEQEPITDETPASVPANEQGEGVTEQEPVTDETPPSVPVNEQSEEIIEQGTEQNPEQATTQLTIMYIITINVGAGGSIHSTLDENTGRAVLSIQPNEGYKIINVVVDGNSVGAVGEYIFESVQANHTITATFEMIPIVEYCVTANAGPNGSIIPEGVICVPEGSPLEFKIVAHEGNIISDVLVDGLFSGASDSFHFDSVSSDRSITAFFATVPVVTSCITAVAGNGGQIIPSGEVCSSGGDVIFSIVPDEGHAVADVLVDGVFIGPVLEHTIAERTQDHTIFVSFVQK